MSDEGCIRTDVDGAVASVVLTDGDAQAGAIDDGAGVVGLAGPAAVCVVPRLPFL